MLKRPLDPSQLPLTLVDDTETFIRGFQGVVLLGAVALAGIVWNVDWPILAKTGILAAPLLIVVLIEAVNRLGGPSWRRVYTLDASAISCTNADASWHESIENYDSVHWREEERAYHDRTEVFQIVELRHRISSNRNVKLIESYSTSGVRVKWESVSRTLDLPATRSLADGTEHRRLPDQLDLSIRDLVAAGELTDDFDPDRPVPRGVRWRKEDDRLEVLIRRTPLFYLLVIIGVIVLTLVLAYAPFGHPILLIPGLSALTAALATALFHHHRLVIEDRHLTLGGRLAGMGYRADRRLPLAEIEAVYRVDPESRLAWLRVETDSVSMVLGPLGAKPCQWLEKFLISAITNAPSQD